MQRTSNSIASRFNVFAACLCLAMGISYICAWFLDARSYLQILQSSTPVHFNAAVLFCFIGVSLLCVTKERFGLARFFAFFVLTGALLTLYGYVQHVDLAIDQLFVMDYFTNAASFPGRPSPNTLICSLLISLSIFIRSKNPTRFSCVIIEILGSCVFALGLTATLGYLSGITAAYTWGTLTNMPIQSAILFTVVGKCTTLSGWVVSEKNSGRSFGAYARPIFFSFAAITLALWQAISVEEHASIAKTVKVAATKTSAELRERFQGAIYEVSNVSQRLNGATVSTKEFDREVARLSKDFSEIDRLAFFDKDHKLVHLYSYNQLGFLYDERTREQLEIDKFLERTKERRQTLVSKPFEVSKDRQHVFVVSPTFAAAEVTGYVVGVVDLHILSEEILKDHLDFGFWAVAIVNHKPIYGSKEISKFTVADLVQESGFTSFGIDWEVYLYPTMSLVTSQDSFLPWIVLISGLLIALLAALMAHIATRSKLREIRVNEINSQLLAEIKRREAAEKELLLARDIADASSRSKSIFLANISHEIRTPIGAMIGFAELMRNGSGVSDYQRSQYIGTIIRNGDLLLRLIDDVLDLSKVEAGKIELEHIETSLVELFSDVQLILGSRAEAKNLELIVRAAGPVPSKIYTDPTRLRQILFNLIGNAIKFTDVGEILLEVRAILPHEGVRKELVFTVKDTGIGLDDEQQRRLFQPFSQGDASTNRKFGGTGLGLDLSRKLATAMGGNIQLLESSVGQGSTFVASIACEPTSDCEWLTRIQPETWNRRKVALANLEEKSQNLGGLSILLVEDAIDNQILFNQFLTISGAKVDIANDGIEGVDMATKKYYDLVLMDVQMPRLNGYEATAKLRTLNYQQPIVALTAHAMKEELSRCLAAGFTDYISKPVKFATLVEKLQKFKTPVSTVTRNLTP
jgi:signal transduction histidine kinase/ActR/RegA family two-component response regulator